MTILAVDTACGACSVALARMDGSLIAEAVETETSRQAERLVPMIQELLQQQKLSYSDLSLLVTTIGPGSFTGLRIGMTAIKGIALVTGLPAMGVSTLETIACHSERSEESHASSGRSFASAQDDKTTLVLLNAQRGQVYAQKFLAGVIATSEPVLLDIAEIPQLAKDAKTIAGNCGDILREIMPGITPLADTLPSAHDAAMLAATRFASGVAFQPPEPLYIRKPDAKLPTRKNPKNL